MSATEEIVIEPQTMKELEVISDRLSDVSAELAAKEYLMARDILALRQTTIAKIPGFWAVVFDHARSELEAAVTPQDLEVFTKALDGVEVTRPEIPATAKPSDEGIDKFGEPRSITVKFHFKENEWFSDSILEKTLYYRYGKDGSSGLVSDPVKINWKAGKDLTEGLTDAAYALWVAQKQNPSQGLDAVLDKDSRKARDAAAKELPEYKDLAKKLEDNVQGAISFFNFLSYRGHWVSAAESQVAKAEYMAKRQAALEGKLEEEEDDDDDEDFAEEDVETFPAGYDVAVSIAEDIWPSAIDYFLEDDIDSDDELDGLEIDEDADVEMS